MEKGIRRDNPHATLSFKLEMHLPLFKIHLCLVRKASLLAPVMNAIRPLELYGLKIIYLF
jgi:hypothetical protein